MKYICAFALVALTSAVAPPRIELNMEEIKQGQATIVKHATKVHTYDLPYTQPDGTGVGSTQDWTERCPVKTKAEFCPLPKATAFDHHNGELEVRKRIFLVDFENNEKEMNGVALPAECTTTSAACTGIDYNSRAIYLIKYDATDASGNHAEQVVFGLIIDDTNPPQISFDAYQCHHTAGGCKEATCTGEHQACKDNVDDQNTCEHIMRARKEWGCEWKQQAAGSRCYNDFTENTFVEAASTWRFCEASALDIVDGDVDVKYAISCMTCATQDQVVISQDTPSDYEGAKNKIDTLTVGTYRITAFAHDNAGGFGAGGENNMATKTVTVNVKDTRSPWITVAGFGIVDDELDKYDDPEYPCDPKMHQWNCTVKGFPLECGTVYQTTCTEEEKQNQFSLGIRCEEGAIQNDKFDDANKITRTPSSSLAATPIDITKTTDQTITYTGDDSNGVAAEPKYRIVSVRDTTPPVLTLTPCDGGICYHEAGSGAWVEPDLGAMCVDACDGEHNNAPGETFPKMVDANDADLAGYPKWEPAFDDMVVGTYKRTYRCKDRAGLMVEQSREVVVADNGKPQIKFDPCSVAGATTHPTLGAPHCLIEATKTGVFTLPPASCSDTIDGTIEMAPPTGVVDLSKVGEYELTYTCADSVDNEQNRTRTVEVKDTTKPKLTLQGESVEYVEAGFPYVDPMVSCQQGCAMDNIDGDLSDRIEVTDGTVTSIAAFAKFRSCAEIKTAFQTVSPGATQSNGWYTVSLMVHGSVELHTVWCDLNTHETGVTYFPSTRITDTVNGADAVVPYNSNDGSCPMKGMKMAKISSVNHVHGAVIREFGDQFAVPINGAAGKSTNYICSLNENDASYVASTHTVQDNTVGDIRHAVPGDYHIRYDVKDLSNNPADHVTREVKVRDTLPPVIVMSLPNNAGQHISDSSAKGIKGVSNPAGDAKHNPFIQPYGKMGKMEKVSLMAEDTSTSVNGWFVAAAASAVAGVALLSMRRDTAVCTSVPV